jgi:hypothetical protein
METSAIWDPLSSWDSCSHVVAVLGTRTLAIATITRISAGMNQRYLNRFSPKFLSRSRALRCGRRFRTKRLTLGGLLRQRSLRGHIQYRMNASVMR